MFSNAVPLALSESQKTVIRQNVLYPFTSGLVISKCRNTIREGRRSTIPFLSFEVTLNGSVDDGIIYNSEQASLRLLPLKQLYTCNTWRELKMQFLDPYPHIKMQ